MLRRVAIAVGLAAALGSLVVPGAAIAHPDGEPAPSDEILAPPPTFKGNDVKVDEHLGAKVPLDARFRTQDGAPTTLGDVLRGELPAILTFNYSDCPMLCSLQLNGLTAAVPEVARPAAPPPGSSAAPSGPGPEEPQRGPGGRNNDIAFQIGAQFRIVTISLEPNESPERLTRMRERYLAKLPEAQRAAARAGWTFLTGDAATVKRVADAVGFSYTYIVDRAEWAHPAALILLSTAGVVTRYVYGIEYEPAMLRESIFKAGLAEPATAVGFMNRCYHYDPDANNHSRAGVMALRIAAAGALVLLLAGLGTLHLLRRTRRPAPAQERVS